MTETIGIGLIGAGWMGALHTASYRRVADHYPECPARPRFVVAADATPAAADAAVRRLGYERATADPLEVIHDPEVQAISIAAPNALHREVALDAAASGVHFWGEKPLGRYPHETADIARAATAAGVRTMVGFNYRHVPAVVRAQELIAAGELGEIANVRGYFLVDYASDPRRALSWRFLEESAGLGVLGDLMSHVVDLAHLLAGEIESVNAQLATVIARRPRPADPGGAQFSLVEDGELGDVENEDYASSLVRYANGALGTFEVSRTMVGRHNELGIEVHGTRGALSWEFQRMNELRLYLPGHPGGDVGYTTVWAGPAHGDFARFEPGTAIPMGYSQLKVVEAGLFLRSVVDGRQRPPGVGEALAAAEVLDAMLRSHESGGWAKVERFAGAATPTR